MLKVVWPIRYRRPEHAGWVEPLRLGFHELARLDQVAADPALLSLAPHLVPFRVEFGDRQIHAALDYGDEPRLRPGLTDAFDLIFKMQYLVGGYDSERVIPGGFISKDLALYGYLPRLRELRHHAKPLADAYGRFGGNKAGAIRRSAVSLLESQNAFSFRGGIGPVRYLESLVEAARSRVCIDLPGNGPLCFRLVEYLAIGCAIVCPPPAARLHVPLEEGKHLITCRSDLADLVEVIASLVGDPRRLNELMRETQLYFDQYLSYRQLSAYYLATSIDRLKARRRGVEGCEAAALERAAAALRSGFMDLRLRAGREEGLPSGRVAEAEDGAGVLDVRRIARGRGLRVGCPPQPLVSATGPTSTAVPMRRRR